MNRISIIPSKKELQYVGKLYIWSLILNLIIELLNKDSLFGTFSDLLHHPHIYLYNSLIILITLCVSIMIKRRIVYIAAISVIWLAFGITNNILLNFRTTPFTAVDLRLISEALPLIDKYLTVTAMIAICVASILAVIGLIFAFIKAPKVTGPINYLANTTIFAMILLFTIGTTKLGMATNILARNFGNIHDAYLDYGFAYCFMNSLINTGMHKPKNYNEDTIQSLVDVTTDEGNSTVETDQKQKKPNIIFLQLESFFDPTHVKDFSFSRDPLPTFRWLKEHYTSGYLSVPSVGAGTANTEFEVITGMNLDFFGPGEYPYKTVLLDTTCESMAYNMKELGYKTHAIHNNTATFYGRNLVFPNLGFDSFSSIEYMQNIEWNPLGWAKDDVLVDEILKAMKSTEEQDYIYTISVQGHGKYPENEAALLSDTKNPSDNPELKDFNKTPGKQSTPDTNFSTKDNKNDKNLDSSNQENNNITQSNKNEKDSNTTSEASKSSSKKTDGSINTDQAKPTGTTKSSTSKGSSTSNKKNSANSVEALSNSAVAYSSSSNITIDGIDSSRKYAFEYYVNQIHEMDQFIAHLILTLENYEEDVVLVMYGDHLPTLEIEKEDLSNEDIYQTEYVIWSNHDVITGKHDRDLEAYELSAYTQELVNQNSGLLTKSHQRAMAIEDVFNEEDPNSLAEVEEQLSISPDFKELPTTKEELDELLLNEFELLQYDMLYGNQDCYGGTNPYEPTNMRLGVVDITIDNVTQKYGSVMISGRNYTECSRVEVDGEIVPATLISNHTFQLNNTSTLSPGSSVCIVQVDNDDDILSRTEAYIIQ